MVAARQRRRSRQEQLALLRPALIELCYEHGYPQLTLADLLGRAGISAGELDPTLATLEDTFCAVLEAERDEFFAYAHRTSAGRTDWLGRLRSVAYALLRHLRSDRARTHFLTIEIHRAGERASLIWTETIVSPLLDLIDEGRRQQHAAASVSRATAKAVAGAAFSRINAVASHGFEQVGDRDIQLLLSVAVLPYLGAEAAAEELSAPPPPDPAAAPWEGGGEE